MLDENIHRHGVLFMLLVDRQGFFIKTVLSGNPCNITSIIVLELVDIPHHLALVRTDSSQE